MEPESTRKHWQGSGAFCAAFNCSNSRKKNPGLSFFSFPKDKERSKIWVQNSRRADLLNKDVEYLNKNVRICGKHFEDAMFMNIKLRNSLVPKAVPTLINVKNPPHRVTPKRPPPKPRTPEPPKKRRRVEFTSSPAIGQAQINSKDHTGDLEAKLTSLKRQVKALKRQVMRWKEKAKKRDLHTNIKLSKKAAQAQKMLDLRTSLSAHLQPAQLNFIMCQIRQGKKGARGRRWTDNDKTFAISLLHSSPKTYKLLQRVFSLPSISTLRKIVAKVDIRPGFCSNILEALRLKTSALPPEEKLVSLVLDEVSIKTAISYDAHRDEIEGLAYTTERKDELANHALVFMVRGLLTKWKLPFGYFLSCSVMPGTEMKTLLLEAVDKLSAIELRVMVIISDQGSNNVKMFKTMGVSEDKPYFEHNGVRIIVMYDPPHLLKSVRNNLASNDLSVNGIDIKWEYIKDFYYQDKAKSVRLAPKLKEYHIDKNRFRNMRVCLAAQILSHSVAAGISAMVDWDLLPAEAQHTADFCEKMDQLFNAFNSSTLTSTSCMRNALSDSTTHIEFLRQTKEWLKNVKHKGSRTPLCLMGWRLSIEGLCLLWRTLKDDYGVKFLMTNRLNQDCVENLFSIVRSKGAARDNPDPREFRGALRQIMVDQVLAPIKNSNCIEDVDQFLVNLAERPVNNSASLLVQPPVPEYQAILDELPDSVKQLVSVCTIFPDMPSQTVDHQ